MQSLWTVGKHVEAERVDVQWTNLDMRWNQNVIAWPGSREGWVYTHADYGREACHQSITDFWSASVQKM